MKLTRIATVLAVIGTCFVGGAVTATSASASGYGCNGSLVNTIPISGGVGEVYVYWDGTYNCAVAVDNAENAKAIDVYLTECASDKPQEFVQCQQIGNASDGDNGDNSYHWYAGPVRLAAGGHCISASGDVYTQSGGYDSTDIDNESMTIDC